MGCLAALLKDDYGLLGCHGDLVGNGPHTYCSFDVHEITDPEATEKYRAGVFSTVAQYRGRYLTVGGKCAVVEGDWRPVLPVIIEFPSLEQALCWYDSTECRELKAWHLAATRGHAVFIGGTASGT